MYCTSKVAQTSPCIAYLNLRNISMNHIKLQNLPFIWSQSTALRVTGTKCSIYYRTMEKLQFSIWEVLRYKRAKYLTDTLLEFGWSISFNIFKCVRLQRNSCSRSLVLPRYLWVRKMGKRLPMGKIPVGHATNRVVTKILPTTFTVDSNWIFGNHPDILLGP